MTDPTPPRRSLAAFLRGAPADPAAPDPDAQDASPPQGASEAVAADSDTDAVPAPVSLAPTAGIAAAAAAPSFLHRAQPAPRAPAPAWQWALFAALALLLVVQVLLADRVRLAADARWRPVVAGLCEVLRCRLPAWRQPDAFTMLTRDVRPVAGESGVLQIRASFRNDARWAQDWPWLQLSLADADGQVIGSRVFAPAEYLGHAVTDTDLLAPQQSTQIAFRVREPAASTAAFTFEFR